MEAWKVERFTENHGEAFPPYRQLSPVECRQILERFATAFEVLDEEDQGLKTLKKLLNLAIPIKNINPFSDSFSLKQWRHAFRPQVLVNWNRFTDIDEISFDDLNRCLADIFLEGSDDIEIFDETCSTVLLLHHWGSVSLVHVPPSEELTS
jgi:hypothetical protein